MEDVLILPSSIGTFTAHTLFCFVWSQISDVNSLYH